MTAPPTTTDFPIPSDLEGFWSWDKMHFPRPQTPLTEEIILHSIDAGFNQAHDEFGLPMHFATRVINYYGYVATLPADPGAEGMDARLARYQDSLTNLVPRVGELWENEWLPSILPGLEKAKTLDYGSMSDAQLMDTLEELRADLLHRWTVHGRINFVTVAASWFADFYNENFHPDDPTEPYQVLQGFPTRSVDAGRGLWRLSRIVRSSAGVKKLFAETEPRGLVPQLERSEDGRAFLEELRAYLDEFGWRSDAFELEMPAWREDPAIPLNALQGYVQLDSDGDPDLRYQQAIQRREELLARSRERLSADPNKLARFNELYEMARHYLPVTENHNFYIDQIGMTILRPAILEIGRRLIRHNAIDNESDVFLVYVAESAEGLTGTDLRPLVARRNSEIEKWSKIVPSPTIGEPPPATGDALEEAFAKMFGIPREPSRDPSIINGIGASTGTAQGRAKVVRNLSEASKVQPGDVLVCEMTMPAWTPLFATVSAVVADTGGVLSHCAIVAREYRMPCVVQTVVGTAVIKDGMLLTVDGSKGIVRIDSRV